MHFCRLTSHDVVRHRLVGRIVAAYDEFDARAESAGAGHQGAPMSIEISNESGLPLDERRLAALSRFAMDRMRIHPLAELSIMVVDVETMAQLHVQWMDEPGPTDVLSFPMDELRPGRSTRSPRRVCSATSCCAPSWPSSRARAAGHGTEAEIELLTRARHPAPARLRPRGAGGARRCSSSRDGCWSTGAPRRLPTSEPAGDSRGGPRRSPVSALWVLVGAAAMVVVAGGFSAADAALSGFSRVRAEELVREGRTGARRVLQILDDAPRYLNVLMLRLLFEIGAIVLVTLTVSDLLDAGGGPRSPPRWA